MNDYDADSAPENGPPAPDSTAGPRAVASTGRPLADPAAGRETGARSGPSSDRTRAHRTIPPLSHDDYQRVVRARMADLDRLAPLPAEVRDGRPLGIVPPGPLSCDAAGSGGAGTAVGPVAGSAAGSLAGPAAAPSAAAAAFLPDERLLVALDVDGTILDIEGRMSERMMTSLVRLRARGVRLVISTGRGIQAALPVAHRVGLTDGWMICANGAITLRMDPTAPRGYEVIDSVTFDPADAIAALSRAVPDGIVAVEVLGGGFKVSRPFPDGELIEAQRVVSLEEMASEPVTRVVLRAPGMDVEEFSELVAGCGLHSVEYAIGWTAWLDVAPDGVTKASALQALAARLGADAERAGHAGRAEHAEQTGHTGHTGHTGQTMHTIAVGDGANDIEMLRWAGIGAAMGSAPQSVKDSSDIVTEPVWHDGCAALLDAVVERTRKRDRS